jgi:hypothetical protein
MVSKNEIYVLDKAAKDEDILARLLENRKIRRLYDTM